ncbi:unnamed protein product [Arabis nemorensis]|uniref:Replication factor A C-terminal domain-containing protein n=1 Tax=Arabis nemorensis TaxID=586526 RepID=A0A565CNT8_9BRAS|nr:unnamed protein product [Arabis nemorensis]
MSHVVGVAESWTNVGQLYAATNVLHQMQLAFSGIIIAWYRVELDVHDGHYPATFVVFDSEMTKLTNKNAATLTLEQGPDTNGTELPTCLQALAGKQFVFQIRVTPFNFTLNHRTFTVSRITEDTTIGADSEDEGNSPTPTTENNTDVPTTSQAVVVDTPHLDMNLDPAPSSGVGNLCQKDKNRKRPRE